MPETRQNEQRSSGSFLWTAVQSVGMFFLVQFLIKQFIQPKTSTASVSSTAPSSASQIIPAFSDRPASLQEGAAYLKEPVSIAPIWPGNPSLDIEVYLSPSWNWGQRLPEPLVSERGFQMGDYKDKREIMKHFPVPKEMAQGGTIWAHIICGLSGSELNPLAKGFDWSKAFHSTRPLTQRLPKRKRAIIRNLLSGSPNVTEEPEDKTPQYANYYHPNFTVSVIPDPGTQRYSQIAPPMKQWITLEQTGARDASGANGWYYPIVYLNTFWQLRDHMHELNETVQEIDFHISMTNLWYYWFTMIVSLDEGAKVNAVKAAEGQSVTGDGSEFEELKKVLLDSNPYLLGVTAVATALHMIFEMLAFKSDIGHWRNKKDNVGVSVRTILANVFMQTVIFLYLVDNNENTSWMILFGQGIGILIEAWKITKTVDIRIRPAPRGSWLPYAITFEDKHKLSETEEKTKEYDQIAFKYLYIIAVPLLLAYAIYSVYYDSHKSWYSFIISTLVGSVYAYGFLMMLPSLYINYRLQSVAHMAGKAMTYKFLNTFIDDLFAFTIKMPTLHRLATFRDDIVFFVYLYQCWKYKTDYSRVNEFGQGGEDEATEEKVAAQPLKASPGQEVDEKGGGRERTEVVKDGVAKATGKAPGNGRKRK